MWGGEVGYRGCSLHVPVFILNIQYCKAKKKKKHQKLNKTNKQKSILFLIKLACPLYFCYSVESGIQKAT